MYKLYTIDIINNLQCVDYTLIISHLDSCQLLVSAATGHGP
jgi:hypothetical protein